MGELLEFKQQEKPPPNQELISSLERILDRVKTGEAIGIMFLLLNRDKTNEFDIRGYYRLHPNECFVPACKGMFTLCTYIESEGLSHKL